MPDQLRLLALDTSTPQGGVAVLRGETVLSRKVWARGKSHSELLTPTITDCLNEASLALADLDRIAVGRGPGSFTGIRIAVNAARSLSFALSKPIVAFDTTEIVAAGCERHDLPIVVLLNAQMNLLFASTFVWDASACHWRRDLPLEALSLEEIEARLKSPHLCLGDGYFDYEPLFSQTLRERLIRDQNCSDYPLPEALGRLGSTSIPQENSPLDWIHLQPLYIRASGAEEKLRGNMGRLE